MSYSDIIRVKNLGKRHIINPLYRPITGDSSIIVADTFNRADNANSLGNADTGQTWENLNGAFGIASNKAISSVSSSRSVINAMAANVLISCEIAWNNNAGIIFHVTDDSNYILARIASGSFNIYRCVANSNISIGSYSFATVANRIYKVAISAKEDNIKVYLDDILIFNVTESFNQTATKCGLKVQGDTVSTFDNFKVEAIQ